MVWNRMYTHAQHTFWNNNMHNILSFTCKKWNIILWTIFIQTKYWRHIAGGPQTIKWRHVAGGSQTKLWRHVAGGSLCVRDNADVSCWRFKPPTVARRRLLPCSGRVDDVCVCHWTRRPNRRVFKGTWTLTVTFRDDIHFKSNHVY